MIISAFSMKDSKIQEIQKFKRFEDSRIQRFKDSKIHPDGYRGRRFEDSRIRRFKRFKDSRIKTIQGFCRKGELNFWIRNLWIFLIRRFILDENLHFKEGSIFELGIFEFLNALRAQLRPLSPMNVIQSTVKECFTRLKSF